MAAYYTLQWYQTFDNGMRTLFSKTSQHCWLSIKMLFSMLFYVDGTTIIPISLFLDRQNGDDEFLYTALV